jgi:RNA polymerase sigma factor (sigma-70 family)
MTGRTCDQGGRRESRAVGRDDRRPLSRSGDELIDGDVAPFAPPAARQKVSTAANSTTRRGGIPSRREGTDSRQSGNYLVMALPLDSEQRRTFEAAFASDFPAIHRYARRRVGHDVADDVAADTFSTAYANWDRLDPARPIRPWLYGIAGNLIRHHYRGEERKLRAFARTGVDPITGEYEGDIVRRVDACSEKRRLAAALADLGADAREVVLLHAWAELDDQEIALALSLPIGTVKSRLHRAREQLRNAIEENGQLDAAAAKDLGRK